MNPWLGNAVVILGIVGTMIIRAPHGQRSRKAKTIKDKKGRLEIALVILVSITMLIFPILAMATSLFSFANYVVSPVAFCCGALAMMGYFWLFYRSHADLGTNWSVSLEIRESHKVITSGVYKNI